MLFTENGILVQLRETEAALADRVRTARENLDGLADRRGQAGHAADLRCILDRGDLLRREAELCFFTSRSNEVKRLLCGGSDVRAGDLLEEWRVFCRRNRAEEIFINTMRRIRK